MTRPLLAVHVAVLLVVVGSGLLASQAAIGRASAYRPIRGQVAACPAAKVVRTP